MLATLAALTLVPVAYGFGPTTKLSYSVSVHFDGYIPILGGQEGKVDVKMPITVLGKALDGENQQAVGEITDFKIVFNGAPLPFTLENVKEYFPKNTVSFTPAGKIVKNDAPNIDIPVKLPGLDPKRFPDITYLPVEFPVDGLSEGQTWSYKKAFGNSDVNYTCKALSIKEDKITIEMQLAQTYDGFEDESKNPVKDEKDAISKVVTTVTGKGTAVFDLKRCVVESFKATADALSQVTDLETKKTSDRKLVTVMDVQLQTGAAGKTDPAESPPQQPKSGVAGWVDRILGSVKDQGPGWLEKAKGWISMLEIGMKSLPSMMPLPVDDWIRQIRQVLGGIFSLNEFSRS